MSTAREFTFEEWMRTGHVKRWQIVRTARQQTLAEHLYRVWVVTNFLCEAFGMPDSIGRVATNWALIHDVPEVITGDIATPTKKAMREAVPDTDPIHNIELSLSVTYKDLWGAAKARYKDWRGPTPYEVVKLADLIEAKCFLGVEKLGDHAEMVYDGICKGVTEHVRGLAQSYPDHNWLLIERLVDKSWIRV